MQQIIDQLNKSGASVIGESTRFRQMQEYMESEIRREEQKRQKHRQSVLNNIPPAPAAQNRPLSAFDGGLPQDDLAVQFEGIDEDYIRQNPQHFPVKDIPFPNYQYTRSSIPIDPLNTKGNWFYDPSRQNKC